MLSENALIEPFCLPRELLSGAGPWFVCLVLWGKKNSVWLKANGNGVCDTQYKHDLFSLCISSLIKQKIAFGFLYEFFFVLLLLL